jgi:hypothetical protein
MVQGRERGGFQGGEVVKSVLSSVFWVLSNSPPTNTTRTNDERFPQLPATRPRDRHSRRPATHYHPTTEILLLTSQKGTVRCGSRFTAHAHQRSRRVQYSAHIKNIPPPPTTTRNINHSLTRPSSLSIDHQHRHVREGPDDDR